LEKTVAKSTTVASQTARPDFTEITLANGARLLLQPDRRLPNLHLRLAVAGGALFEEAGQRGSSSLLTTLLTKDAGKRSAAQVAQFIEEVGGSFYPLSGNNSLGVAAEVLPPDFERALSVISDAVLAPAFKPATFKLEQEAQLAALAEDADDVVTFARKLTRRKFFGAHPLSLDASGNEAGVKALTPAALRALHQKLFVGGNVVFAVTGDFDVKKLTPKLKAFLSKIPKGAAPPVPALGVKSRDLPAEVGDFVEKQPREQAVVLQAFPGTRVHAPDYYAGEVADELFSGMASRLFERVREEKGLAYFVRSGRIMGLDTGMFYFFAGTQPGKEGEVLAEIDAEIARVQAGGVEEIELRRCQARLKAGQRAAMQTNSSRALQASLNALQGQPINAWRNYDAKIDAVTVADLAAFATKYFKKDRRTQVVVRP
jgi:zinc protease